MSIYEASGKGREGQMTHGRCWVADGCIRDRVHARNIDGGLERRESRLGGHRRQRARRLDCSREGELRKELSARPKRSTSKSGSSLNIRREVGSEKNRELSRSLGPLSLS